MVTAASELIQVIEYVPTLELSWSIVGNSGAHRRPSQGETEYKITTYVLVCMYVCMCAWCSSAIKSYRGKD
jgi:hypothetical protein